MFSRKIADTNALMPATFGIMVTARAGEKKEVMNAQL
jgi:hypothetical protein